MPRLLSNQGISNKNTYSRKDMNLGFSKKLIIVLLSTASILSANQASSRPTTDKMTICYGVDKQDNMSFKTPCMVSDWGGAGLSILTYRINGKDYDIETSNDGDFLNGKPYKTYVRDAFFSRVTDGSDEYSYYCYKSKLAHFCSQQNAN